MVEKEPSMDEILNSIRTILAQGEADASDEDVRNEQVVLQEVLREEEPVAKVVAEPETVLVEQPEPQKIEIEEPIQTLEADFNTETKEDSVDEDITVDLTDDMIVSRKNSADKTEIVARENIEEETSSWKPSDEKISPKENDMTMYQNEKNDELISAATQASTAASLSQLTQAFSAQKISSPTGQSNGMTLEFLVSELLKPYLKEWLDKNLPAIVDEAVKKEIARIVDRSVR